MVRQRAALWLAVAALLAAGCGDTYESGPGGGTGGEVVYGILFKDPVVATGATVQTTQPTMVVMGIGPFADWSGPFTGGCINRVPTPADFYWHNVTTGAGGQASAYATNEWLAGCYFGDAVWGATVTVAPGVNRVEFEALRAGSRAGWDWFQIERTTP